jgi:hypothetical protein
MDGLLYSTDELWYGQQTDHALTTDIDKFYEVLDNLNDTYAAKNHQHNEYVSTVELNGKADVDHNHDSVYYIKSEVDDKIANTKSVLDTSIQNAVSSISTEYEDNLDAVKAEYDKKISALTMDVDNKLSSLKTEIVELINEMFAEKSEDATEEPSTSDTATSDATNA